MTFHFNSFILLYMIIFGRGEVFSLQHRHISTNNRNFQTPYRLVLIDSWRTTVHMVQEEKVRLILQRSFD